MDRLTPVPSSSETRKPIARLTATVFPQSKFHKPTDYRIEQQRQENGVIAKYNVVDEGKSRLLDRWLDAVVSASGSCPVLFLTLALVLLWALMGIRYGQSENWQVLISDVQALLCYILDSLLMRQQLNAHNRVIGVVAVMKSRSISVRRMLLKVQKSHHKSDLPELGQIPNKGVEAVALQVDPASRTYKIIDMVCGFLGHVATMILFWICIFIWLGFGPFCNWSVRWQLYINSATSALMIVVFTLLTYIREQHKIHTHSYLRKVCDLDMNLEIQLRQLTQDDISEQSVTIDGNRLGRLERLISYYADLVGTLVGILLLVSMMVIWIAIGPALHFDSNWWLIIGTYAGLIGMHDGFVLHNIQSQLNRHSQASLADVMRNDLEALEIASLAPIRSTTDPESQVLQARSLTNRNLSTKISTHLSNSMSHPFAVLVGIFIILALLVIASALHWSATGQLLCNIPPSIIETFVMMALITREKLDWAEDRQIWCDIGEKRAMLIEWVERAQVDVVSEDKMDSKEKAVGEVEEVTKTQMGDDDGIEVA